MNLARGVRALAMVLALWLAGCGDGVHRGRVIDQDTGEPVAGAIVVGRYTGSIAWSGSSCNRVESAVSYAEGWFELPVDAKDGEPLLEGYSRGYDRGRPSRFAILRNSWTREWRVSIQQWNDDNSQSTWLGDEPETYVTEASALAASGETRDVFIRKSRGTRQARLTELRSYQTDCGGSPRGSRGLSPLVESILREQVELGDSEDGLMATKKLLEWANSKSSGASTSTK